METGHGVSVACTNFQRGLLLISVGPGSWVRGGGWPSLPSQLAGLRRSSLASAERSLAGRWGFGFEGEDGRRGGTEVVACCVTTGYY